MHAFERGGVTPEGLLRGRKSANVRVSSGSFTVSRSTAMNGGSTAHTCRSRLDGSYASFSGHSAGGGDWRPSAHCCRSGLEAVKVS